MPRAPESLSTDFIKAQKLMHATTLQDTVEDMHRRVTENLTCGREKTVKKRNKSTQVQVVLFEFGGLCWWRREPDMLDTSFG